MAKKRRRKRGKRKINRTTMVIIVVVGLLFFASVRNIITLKIENYELKKENEELRQLSKELAIELKNVNSKEYVEERARRQLRLVNPDEIIFVFPGDERYVQGTD